MMNTRALPNLSPADVALLSSRPASALIKACTAKLVGLTRQGDADAFLGRDSLQAKAAALLLRAASAPATISDPAWAGSLASAAVTEFLKSLGPASAASQIIRAALNIEFPDATSSILIPALTVNANLFGFVGEGAPIPVQALNVGQPSLTPRKLAAIASFTKEMAQRASFEEIVRTTLIESAALAVDNAMFSSTAGDATRPAGLRAGVSALTATSGGGDAAMMRDLGALVAAVAAVGGSQIVIVAAPSEAAKILLRSAPAFAFPVLATSALPSGTVTAIAVNALAVAVDPIPEVDATSESALHYDDGPAQLAVPTGLTAPQPASAVAAPVRSTYQSALLALRLILRVDWTLRTNGSIAWTQNVTW
jgi:hypothetical protein